MIDKIWKSDKFKGILWTLVIALIAWYSVQWIPFFKALGAPIMAMSIGMFMIFTRGEDASLKPGLNFSSKKMLQWAIILLGFGLNISTLQSVGQKTLPLIVITISTALIGGYSLSKRFNLPTPVTILITIGSSICGGSAIAATAPVIDAKEDEVAQAMAVIFIFNALAALVFPWLGGWLGLSNQAFARLVGTAVNDTSSVTAAASTWDALYLTGGVVLQEATIIKLVRTLAIIPLTLGLTLYRKRQQKTSKRHQVFPMFILYFVIASFMTTLIHAYASTMVIGYYQIWMGYASMLSKFMIVVAMAAIGLSTDVRGLVQKGYKSVLFGLCCSLLILTTSLLYQYFMSGWY